MVRKVKAKCGAHQQCLGDACPYRVENKQLKSVAARQSRGRKGADGHPSSDAMPRYYPKTGELWVGDVKVRRYGRRGKQHLILKEFQRLRWPPCIDAPPGCQPLTVENRSRDVIHLLNQNHSRALIHFSSDGTGLGVCWKLLEERVVNEPGGQPPTMGVRRPNGARLGHTNPKRQRGNQRSRA